jgi:hypothetical protein
VLLEINNAIAARCTVVVAKQWVEYIGAGSYGLEFKDESGRASEHKESIHFRQRGGKNYALIL